MAGASRVDAGFAGVWVLDTSGQVFVLKSTFGDSGTTGKSFFRANVNEFWILYI